MFSFRSTSLWDVTSTLRNVFGDGCFFYNTFLRMCVVPVNAASWIIQYLDWAGTLRKFLRNFLNARGAEPRHQSPRVWFPSLIPVSVEFYSLIFFIFQPFLRLLLGLTLWSFGTVASVWYFPSLWCFITMSSPSGPHVFGHFIEWSPAQH